MDMQERISILFIIVIELCRVSMGCFTTVFISYSCTNLVECETKQEVMPSTVLGQVAFVSNVLTCISFLVLYLFELYRDNWLIQILDRDPNVSETNLKYEIANTSFETRLLKIGHRYIRVVLFVFGLFICNVILSAAFIWDAYSQSSISSLASFFSFTVLLAQKVGHSSTVAFHGIQEDYAAESSFLTIPHRFNIIDEDLKILLMGEKIIEKRKKHAAKIYPVVLV